MTNKLNEEQEKEYVTTKEECEKNIHGVCEGCGGKLTAIKTVDNSNHPTYWQGCEHCSCFRGGVERRYFEIARQLVEAGDLLPYSHMRRADYEKTPEQLEYYLDSQTAGLSYQIARIDKLLSASHTEKQEVTSKSDDDLKKDIDRSWRNSNHHG